MISMMTADYEEKRFAHNDSSDEDDDGSKVVEGLEHKLMFVIFPDLENGGIS